MRNVFTIAIDNDVARQLDCVRATGAARTVCGRRTDKFFKRMVGSTPDLGVLCLESRGIPLTPRPQTTPSWRNCNSRTSLQSASGSLCSDHDVSCSIAKIAHILAQRAKEKQNDLRRAFETYDKVRNLTVTKGEFRKVIERFLLPLNPKQFQDLLARIPINSDETVPYMVFLEKFCSSHESCVRRASSRSSSIISNCNLTLKQVENHLREKIFNNVKNLLRAFKLFDYNKDEHIQCYELRRVLESYCLRLTDSQFERLCSRYNLSRTGTVNYVQFLQKLGIHVESSNKCSKECVAQAMNWENGVQKQEKKPKLQQQVTEEPPINSKSLSMDEIYSTFQKKLHSNYHELLQAFSTSDVTKSGLVSMEELQTIFNNVLFSMSKEVFDHIMGRYKIETNGKVAWKQFLLTRSESQPLEDKWALSKHQPNHIPSQVESTTVIQETPRSPACGSHKSGAKLDLSSCHSLTHTGEMFGNKKVMDVVLKLHKYFQERYPALEEEKCKDLIARQELRQILQHFPFRLTDEEIKTFMLLLDPQHSGYFHYNQLMELIEGKKNQSSLNGTKTVKKHTPAAAIWKTVEDILCDKIRHNWDEIQKSFMMNDPERTGTISLAKLRKILETHCLSISDQHLEKLCKQQQNNSVQVSYQQFLENLGVTDMPKINSTEAPVLNQKRLIKKENEDSMFCKKMTLNEVKSELWERIIYCDSNIRKSFLTHKNQCTGKINKEGFKKVLQDCGIIMDEHQLNILANVLGFTNQDLDFHDFSEHFKDYTTANPDVAIKQSSSKGADWKMRRMIADDCFNYIFEKVKHSSLDLQVLFDQLDRNHDGLITMYDFRTLLDDFPLTVTTTEYHRFLEMLGLLPESKLTYLEFLKIIRIIESKQDQRWNKSAHNSREDTDNTYLICEQAHDHLSNKAKTKWHEMNKAFNQIDSEGNPIVQKRDIKELLCRPCMPISPKQFETLWSWYDPDNKGFVTYFEFLQKLRSRFGSQIQSDRKQIVPETKNNLKDSSEQHQVYADSIQKQRLHTGKFNIKELQKQLKAMFRDHHKGFNETFSKLDKCNDGCITISDFQSVLKDHNYQLGQEQLKQLLVRLEIPLYNSKFSYSHLLRAIEGIEDKSLKCGSKLTLIPHENIETPSPEKVITRLKGVVLKSYGALFKAAEVPDGEAARPKSSQQLTMNDITSHVREVVNKCLYTITQEFEDIDYANIKVISKKNFKEIFFKHFMSLTDEQFENLWNQLPVNEYGNLEYHKFLKQFTGQELLDMNSSRASSGTKLSTSRSASRSSSSRSCKTASAILGNEKPMEFSQQSASLASSMNCEAIEQRLKKYIKLFWKEIQKECIEKDTEKQGEVEATAFQAVMKKFCIPIKPEEFQQLAKKYETKNVGHFAYSEFLQHLILSLGKLDTNPLQRMRIPHPKIPMSPGMQHETLTQLMMRIQPCITKCWKLMRRTFKAYDETGSGYLSLFLFRQVLQQYGIKLSEEEFYYLSSYYDKHLQGTISYNEFLHVFL
ncbi:EF-hand calcium-binding domain-containing protein 6 isoform X3 [Hypanus sabinus]|uniref:EF-hand calcium-binding domain-containing protein 6 isoform X3 n=1 Tax=Hypanus sabinus TaxID=79690 RepID=UPI0028C3BA59|nr:EF-hand calcium-binding domain-containing protein 6 isoform X3 [Hypanus sabinus]